MPRGRPLAPLTLTDEQQDQLNGIAQSATWGAPSFLGHGLEGRIRMSKEVGAWFGQGV